MTMPVLSIQRKTNPLARVKADLAMPYRMRRVDGEILLTNDFGDFVFVNDDEFERFIEGRIAPGDELHERLSSRNFLSGTVDHKGLVERMKHKMRFLQYGPNLHILIVTLRCNHGCQYCHASRTDMDEVETDMSIETAEKCVDMIFQTTSPGVTIEFQGGEPLVNWPVVQHVIEYARQKNALIGKSLSFALVTNLSLMDDEKLDYLIERKVQICTSLDGPEDLHNRVRVWRQGNSHETTLGWVKKINARYAAMQLDPGLYHVEALPTITRQSLPHAKEIIDVFVEIGCNAVFLRHIDPFGFANVTRRTLGYEMPEFLAFYHDAFEHIVELNRNGVQIMERTAAIFLSKILGHEEPNFLDIRTPCGAGIGQIAYNYDGSVFTCDEGRMIDKMGDPAFKMGNVHDDTYLDMITGEVVRAMSVASALDGQPDCVECVYKPYCGICPTHNFLEQGSIQGRMRDSSWCFKHKNIQDLLMERIHRADAFEMEMFKRWITVREQAHFVQECAAF